MGVDSLDGITARVEALEGQVKEVFERLNDRECGPTVLAAKLNSVLVAVGEVKQAVEGLKERPSRLWDNLINAGMAAGIGAVIGLMIAHIK